MTSPPFSSKESPLSFIKHITHQNNSFFIKCTYVPATFLREVIIHSVNCFIFFILHCFRCFVHSKRCYMIYCYGLFLHPSDEEPTLCKKKRSLASLLGLIPTVFYILLTASFCTYLQGFSRISSKKTLRKKNGNTRMLLHSYLY